MASAHLHRRVPGAFASAVTAALVVLAAAPADAVGTGGAPDEPLSASVATPAASEPEVQTRSLDVIEPSTPVPGATQVVTTQERVEEFTVVGVSLPAVEAPADLAVEIRTATGDTWSGWEEVDVSKDSGPDASTGEGSPGRLVSEPLVAVGADAVQVRMTTAAPAQLPASLVATTVDAGAPTAADRAVTTAAPTPSTVAGLAVRRPAVVTRAQWGANESWRTRSPGCDGKPDYASTLKGATLHHTAGVNTYSAAEVPGIVRSIYAFHTAPTGNAWCDIGYNALVDKFGRVFEGRFGGLDRPVVGAHAGGFNTGSFGISMIGSYDQVSVPPAVISSVAGMIAWKFALHNVAPQGRVDYISGGSSKYPAGRVVDLPTIFAHRDVGLAVCPGANGYAQLPAVRNQVSALTDRAQMVVAWYQDFLGRPADGGAVSWSDLLNRGASPQQSLALFLTNREYASAEIRRSYQQLLGRPAEQAGLDGWVDAVQQGRMSLELVPQLLVQTPEYYQRAGGTDAAYVRAVYRDVLGRPASDAEAGYWAGEVARQGRGAVVLGIWRSTEAANRRVAANYRLVLGREVDQPSLSGWAAFEITAGDAAMRIALGTSAEYVVRAGQRF